MSGSALFEEAHERAVALDAVSPLAHTRARFDLPEDVVYLVGNSLGALPVGVPARTAEVVARQWGHGLVGSWNDAGWMDLPTRVGSRIAPFVGAGTGDLLVGDSTTVCLFRALVSAARLRPGRRRLVIEPSTFPTDLYIAQGVAEVLDLEVVWCDPADPVASVDDDTAVVCLTHVDFRTGATYDLAAVTTGVHAAGAVVVWDLSHSTGAVPVDLTGADADLAVGCTYKYLSGGPGAPAFTWVAPRHQPHLRQPLPGWMGHVRPFAMEREHDAAPGIAAMASGTPPVLALSALDAALDAFDGVTPEDLRVVSLSLSDLFLDLVAEHLPGRVEPVTPREHARRGSQVSLRHEHAYGLVRALAVRGVQGDFRDPDLARFGLAPLYVRHVDVVTAVREMVAVLDAEEHLDPAYAVRNAVT